MFVTVRYIFVALGALAAAAPAFSQDRKGNWDGLVEVRPERLDTAFLLPGADFRPYKRLLLEPVTVAFRPDWLRDAHASTRISARVTDEDAKEIAERTRELFAEEFQDAFRDAGLALAESPAEDVLKVRAGVIDLYLAAPDVDPSPRTRVYTMEPGEATLFVEVFDSTSGALLGRAIDERELRDIGRFRITNRVTNEADLRALFRRWAEISVASFRELRNVSPVPRDLEPGQRIGR